MPEYKPLLEEYAQNLDKRVAAGEIKENTRDTYLRNASRLFEALVCWALSEDLLNKATF